MPCIFLIWLSAAAIILVIRLLGFRLSESIPQVDIVNSVVDEVIQVCTHYDRLDNYLKVVDAYMDIILQNQMDIYLNTILEGISRRIFNKEIFEDELGSLQSILMKLLSNTKDLKDVFALSHFLEILDVMCGTPRNVVNISILKIASRNGYLRDPTIIQLLFEITQSLHYGLDFANMKDDDNQQATRLISRFIQMVDYGGAVEQHLTFLVECRGAFGSINEIKETLVHSSNFLATKALKDGEKHLSFVKSCLAFCEVTIPSISAQIRQLNLYLETAEVALIGGLVSHSDGLIVSAISCLESAHFTDGSRTSIDVDVILSSIHKLCGLLVMVPANPKEGITKVPKSILSLIYSQSWMTSKMKARIFLAIVLLSATLSQRNLPYHACNSEILGNNFLYFGESSYVNELVSLTECVIRNLVDSIEQEPSKVARGSMALEACNSIVSSFKASNEVAQVCCKLIEIARMCLSANDRYLQSTFKYLSEWLPNSQVVTSVAS
uniref:UPF0505 protein C16orf62 homolog n=2 Tax=Rhizophora mucronata TaxID=61149 RepID=A0A2P2LXU0_RHIMU